MSLQKEIKEYLLEQGAVKVGFTTLETLEGGPPGSDITYVLPEAQSAISYALPLNRDLIRPYLKKEPNSRCELEKDRFDLNMKGWDISKKVAELLKKKGFKAFPVMQNFKYRKELEDWKYELPPDISLRYLAVRGGVGLFGWSGNLGLKGYGPNLVLGAIVTSAKLEPTDPLPESESFCNKCKVCVKVCAFRMFDEEEEVTIKIGGQEYTHAKRIDKGRCHMVCGGYSGLDITGKWSTWSAGRYEQPKTKHEAIVSLIRAQKNWFKLPKREDVKFYDYKDIEELQNVPFIGHKTVKLGEYLSFTCGHCQIVCWGDPKETNENYRLLRNSGCVVQKEDGTIVVLPPEEAKKAFDELNPEHKKLYQ